MATRRGGFIVVRKIIKSLDHSSEFKTILQKLSLGDHLQNLAKTNLNRGMEFQTMWYVRPAKPQISLRICAVWSEPLLVALIYYEC